MKSGLTRARVDDPRANAEANMSPASVAEVHPPVAARPAIGFGEVRHARLRPKSHAFAYPTYFLMLPMRSIRVNGPGTLAVNRAAPISFHDRDHGDGRGPDGGGALAWLDELLADAHIKDAAGEVWLHCYPRVLGYAFKPVSFWYCHAATGALRVIVVEVNNTFGERHCYVLDHPVYGMEMKAAKAFHVSPFCHVAGDYRFRFFVDEARTRTVVRIDHHDADGLLLQTSVNGALVPFDAASARHAFWRYPAMTFGVIARIHWQAIRLWLKRVRIVAKPAPPETPVSREAGPTP